MNTYNKEYYEKNKEKILQYQKDKWDTVIKKRWYIRNKCLDPTMSKSYQSRNKTRAMKNKTTGRDKEIYAKQNAWIKKQYEKYL